MARSIAVVLGFLVLSQIALGMLHVSIEDETDQMIRQFFRREIGESEDVSTTPSTTSTEQSSSGSASQQSAPKQDSSPPASGQQVPRPYHNAPPQSVFVPPFGPHMHRGPQQVLPPHQFVATSFGQQQQVNNNNGWSRFPVPPMPVGPIPVRPILPTQPSQGQSFAGGIGKRLLSLVSAENDGDDPDSTNNSSSKQPDLAIEKVLQNNTIVQQLNKGIHSVYNNLSKMWNSTIQRQLNLLEEKFKKQTENSTNSREQRIAQQVPNFFKTMMQRIQEAQDNLNNVWSQLSNRKANETDTRSINQNANPLEGGNFFNNWHHDNFFGFNNALIGQQQPKVGNQITDFWQNQVAPQVNKVRSMLARTWQDLTQTGSQLPLAESPIAFGGRMRNQLDNGAKAPSDQTLDNLLDGVNLTTGPEYKLESSEQQIIITPNNQFNEHITNLQKDINKMWQGLTGFMQNAINNVNNTLINARQSQPSPIFGYDFKPFHPQQHQIKPQLQSNEDPDVAEVQDKIAELMGAQKNTDQVYSALQQQEARNRVQNAQKNLFNFDLSSLERIPVVVAVRDFFNQAPGKWDRFSQPTIQKQPPKLTTASTSTSTTTTTTESTNSEGGQ